MKLKKLSCSIFCLLLTFFANAQTWKSKEYTAQPYRKVLVLAKISNAITKRKMEDEVVKLLEEKGVKAISAYQHVTATDLATEAALLAKADVLEVDALITYEVVGKETNYKNKASVNLSTGVPVKMGIFRGFIGGNVPLTGGVKETPIIKVNANLYNRAASTVQWSVEMKEKYKSSEEKVIQNFAKTSIQTMFKENIFVVE